MVNKGLTPTPKKALPEAIFRFTTHHILCQCSTSPRHLWHPPRRRRKSAVDQGHGGLSNKHVLFRGATCALSGDSPRLEQTRISASPSGTWTYWGWKGGYFDSEEDARAFYDEMRFMLATPDGGAQLPQWFNTGLHWAYGIDGPARATTTSTSDRQADPLQESPTSIPSPTPASSSRVADDLVNEGGIMDLWVREARLFKYGSGTGTNFSKLRGEGESALRRRQVLRPDELPEDRRPRRRRHQVRRHHPARRQDGGGRHRPPGHRGIHRLEGGRGAEGRRPGRRLEALPTSTSTRSWRPATAKPADDEDRFDPKRTRR